MRNQRQMLVEQLDRKIMPFIEAGNVQIPDKGWIFSLRNTLNMTLEQLGQRLNITRQGVKRIEKSEASGTISINLLREVGRAMDMSLVYGFIPRHGSVSNLIEKKSYELAERIIQRTDQTMMLEDQANEKEYLKTAVEDLAAQIRQELRRSIWD
jgi:predicted DNA-binding mobile mystery protein A